MWTVPYYQPKRGNSDKVAKKLGILLNPPALVVIYEDKSGTGAVKRKKRIIPVQRLFDYKLSINFMTLDVQADHLHDIEGPSASHIEKMLRIIQEHKKGISLNDALAVISKEYNVQANENLNKLSTPALQRKKAFMQQSYLKNCIKPGDPGYVYDKQIEFDSVEKEPADWDSDEEIENLAKDLMSSAL